MTPVRILVVDDEPDMEPLFRQQLRRDLKKGRFELSFATSGRDALSLMDEDEPPSVVLVLSDVNMPGMSGLELVARLRPLRPSLTISMVTAYDDDETLAEARARGADRVFSKPIDFALLKDYLNDLIAA
ncbi:response regulator [Pacificoceanicola onchidii]|uniref:response regulator n=1 Tax=Pacificoceanicola onchidii TaxID=2562685 RepID=UPI0010A35C80|nr:response regulator [Pacificoceanicola onchidii]